LAELFRIHIALNGADPYASNLACLAASIKEWSGVANEHAAKSARIDPYQENRGSRMSCKPIPGFAAGRSDAPARAGLEPLEQRRDALTAANAHGHQP
jgi:hypothetical protein